MSEDIPVYSLPEKKLSLDEFLKLVRSKFSQPIKFNSVFASPNLYPLHSIAKTLDEKEIEKLGCTKPELIEKLTESEKILFIAYYEYLGGKLEKSLSIIDSLLWKSGMSRSLLRVINARHQFYRMRSSESGYLYDKSEMFHIPFELRGKVTNQRYSMSGYPCLYLADSVYCCWEELGRPNFETSNVAGICNIEELRVLDLRFPDKIESVADLLRLELVMACSLKPEHPEDVFKPEYILSQNILHSLIKYNQTYEKEPKKRIHGIVFSSTFAGHPQRFIDDISFYNNYVFPVLSSASLKTGLCLNLCNEFEMSNVMSFNVLKNRPQLPGVILSPRVAEPLTDRENYKNTNFYKLERAVCMGNKESDYKKVSANSLKF